MEKQSFKEVVPFDACGFHQERRRSITALALQKHPDRLPVVLENAWRSQLPDVDTKMFFVPDVWTVGNFVYHIQNRLNRIPVFMFVKNMPLPTATLMSDLYKQQKDVDGFLYMTYSGKLLYNSYDCVVPVHEL